MIDTLFIAPSPQCDGACRYCFSPSRDGPLLDTSLLEKGLFLYHEYHQKTASKRSGICFHGGEPLLAGLDFYRHVLPQIRRISGQAADLSIQSNLLGLDAEMCQLFKEYNVAVGTSLDGPQGINDGQRGKNYYNRNSRSRVLLEQYGLSPGYIATFTARSARQAREVFHFFLDRGLSFEFHPAILPLSPCADRSCFLPPAQYGELLVFLMELYLNHLMSIKVEPLDSLLKGISSGYTGLCTFSTCLGSYLVLASDGELYSCTRFLGHHEFSLGNLAAITSLEEIRHSRGWRKLEQWYERAEKWCSSCAFIDICHGGCPFAGFAAGAGEPERDPYCPAYQKLFKYVLDRGVGEFFSSSHLEHMLKDEPPSSFEQFKQAPLVNLMGEDVHPCDLAVQSQEIITASLLGIYHTPREASSRLAELGLAPSRESALMRLNSLEKRLTTSPRVPEKCYLNITSRCNHYCSYCFNDFPDGEDHLSLAVIEQWITDGLSEGVEKIIITGGEPLLYPCLEELLNFLVEKKDRAGRTRLILRTNFSIALEEQVKQLLFAAFDELVVSLEGKEEFHDGIRGKGAYRMALKQLTSIRGQGDRKKISLAAVVDYPCSDEEMAARREHLLEVKESLGLRAVRFAPLLPLGRAKNLCLQRPPEEQLTLREWVSNGYTPRGGCGFGHTLMVNPDGAVYPCHAGMKKKNYLGNACRQSLKEVSVSPGFVQLKKRIFPGHCATCTVRYICGGGCLVWAKKDCQSNFKRASSLIDEAAAYLGIRLKNRD